MRKEWYSRFDLLQTNMENDALSSLINTMNVDVVQVLDPIDGTRGFLKGDDALYVVCLFSLRFSFPFTVSKMVLLRVTDI